jgi:2-polyprenyl-3-methyl-5-hydroxy-6-metoxy-1,4-benzoquinol methylase
MIACPACGATDSNLLALLECPCCQNKILHLQNIYYFHPKAIETFKDHSQISLRLIHEHENKHFWLKTREKFILKQITPFLKENEHFIEAGAGTASIAKKIKKLGLIVSVGDIQDYGLLDLKKSDVDWLFQFDISQAQIFVNHFDSIGFFDVIEHLNDETKIITNLRHMLKPGGRVFLTAPAYKWLWSKRDVLEGHKRRYRLKDIITKFEENGFTIIKTRYYFTSILPLLALRSLIDKVIGLNVKDGDHTKSLRINKYINSILYYLTEFEYYLTEHINMPLGGSIFLVAQKK